MVEIGEVYIYQNFDRDLDGFILIVREIRGEAPVYRRLSYMTKLHDYGSLEIDHFLKVTKKVL